MTQTNTLKEVKASIRGILNSTSSLLRANDLRYDYEKFDGTPIPYRELGFRTLVDFLRSIPDTVEIVEPNNTHNPLLKMVEDEKTTHIANFVVCQKNDNKSNRRFRPKRTMMSRRPCHSSLITYEFKKKLWRIISRHPNGLLLRHFKQEVDELMKASSMQRLTVDQIISDINYFTRVDGNMIHLLPHAKRNENIVCNATPNNRGSSPENNQMVPSDSDFESADEDDVEPLGDKSAINNQRSHVEDMDENDVESDSDYPHENDPLVSRTLINNFRALLDEKENQEGIWLHLLEDKYMNKFNCELPLRVNGFHDVQDMVTSLKDVFTYYHYSIEGSYLVKDARKCKKSDGDETVAPQIPSTLLRDIRTLLRQRDKKSVYADELPLMYQRLFHKTLEYSDYGFDSDSFFKNLDQCHDIVFRNSQKRTVISLNEQSKNENMETNADDASLNFPSYNPFPRDVCGTEFKLDPDPLLEEIHKRDKFDVEIAEVYTPGKFYLHFKKNLDKLERMMEDMNEFYNTNEESYEVLASVITRRLLCVCRYSADSKWHRVSLMSVNLLEAKAKFIDYGTVETVKVADLRYLHRDYSVLPALCFRAKLAGIRPKKDSFETGGANIYNKNVIKKFYIYLSEIRHSLQAELVEYNVKTESYEVNLMSCIDGPNQSVRQVLIDEGLVEAETSSSLQTSTIQNTKGKRTSPTSMLSMPPETPVTLAEKSLSPITEDVKAYTSDLLTSKLTPSPPLSSLSSLASNYSIGDEFNGPKVNNQPSNYSIDDEFNGPKAGPPPGLNYSISRPQMDTPKYSTSSYTADMPYHDPMMTIPSPTINPFHGENLNYATPTYAASTFTTPTYAASTYATPTYTAPTYATPTYTAPTYATPTYAAPTYGSTYGAPTYGSTYAAPMYGSTYAAPTYNSTYAAPTYGSTYAGSEIYTSMSSPFVPSPSQPYYAPSLYSTYATYSYNHSRLPRMTMPMSSNFANPPRPPLVVRPPPGLRPMFQPQGPPGFAPQPSYVPTSYSANSSANSTSVVTSQPVNAGKVAKSSMSDCNGNTKFAATSATVQSSKPEVDVEFISNLAKMNLTEKSANKETSPVSNKLFHLENMREKVRVENEVKQYFETSLENTSEEQEDDENVKNSTVDTSKSTSEEIDVTENHQNSVNVDTSTTYTSHVNDDFAPSKSTSEDIDVPKDCQNSVNVDTSTTYTSHVNGVSAAQSTCSNVSNIKVSTGDSESSADKSINKKRLLNPIKRFVLQHTKPKSS